MVQGIYITVAYGVRLLALASISGAI